MFSRFCMFSGMAGIVGLAAMPVVGVTLGGGPQDYVVPIFILLGMLTLPCAFFGIRFVVKGD